MCNRVEKPCHSKKHRNSGGFSLIELAIVITVVGLLVIPLIRVYDNYKQEKLLGDTQYAQIQASQALANFYEMNGRYPCPSDRSIGFGQPGHGEERCTELLEMGDGTCRSDGGFCRAGSSPTNAVFIGGLPYRTMDIPMPEAIDAWKNMLNYVVTASMADPSEDAVFDPDAGAVIIRDEAGNLANGGDPIHGIVMSAGSDGAGAYSINGGAKPCRQGLVQTENCDNDTTFVNSVIYEAPGPGYFDDMLYLTDWSRSTIWAYSSNPDALPESVHNTNDGFIGIGTDTPRVDLDVVGNIRSEQVHSESFCTDTNVNCMRPETIGGAGTSCPDGEFMHGIDNNTARCRPVAVNVQNENCPAGRYVTGISNNRIVCSAP